MGWNETMVHNYLINVRSKIKKLSELPENKDKIRDLFRLYQDIETCHEFIKSSESDYHIKNTLANLLKEVEDSFNCKSYFEKGFQELIKNLK